VPPETIKHSASRMTEGTPYSSMMITRGFME
jgi:hypothetical protein